MQQQQQALRRHGHYSPGEEEIEQISLRLHQLLIEELEAEKLEGLPAERKHRAVEEAARALLKREFPTVVGSAQVDLAERAADEILGLGPIELLVRDPSISEVMVNGPDEVYCERDGILSRSTVRFRDKQHIVQIIERIVHPLGRRVDEASPMVDARLPDGSRVNIAIPPVVPRSPVVTIRKFRADKLSMDDLIGGGTLTDDIAAFLNACVVMRLSILISGGSGTGKTTLLNALSASIPPDERIITIEDPMEVRLQQPHVVSMEARPPSIEGRGEIDQRTLLRNALRMRPDRIIIGEVRGPEAFDMLNAMNTGHEGSLSTIHANSPRDALSRVENMVLTAGLDLPERAIREQLASALHLLVQIARFRDGVRRVTQVTEVSGMEGNVVTLQDIFRFRQEGVDGDGRVIGRLAPTGVRPDFVERFAEASIRLPPNIFAPRQW
ncbi:MAG: CpaF family protein [Dehalococcoidia bacterium]